MQVDPTYAQGKLALQSTKQTNMNGTLTDRPTCKGQDAQAVQTTSRPDNCAIYGALSNLHKSIELGQGLKLQ